MMPRRWASSLERIFVIFLLLKEETGGGVEMHELEEASTGDLCIIARRMICFEEYFLFSIQYPIDYLQISRWI